MANIFRELTEDEVRDEFIGKVCDIVEYHDRTKKDVRDKLEGVAFSILVLLDGENIDAPKFIVAPDPHPEDKDFYIGEGLNYYPENHMNNINCDISGSLHETFCAHLRKKEGNTNE